MAYDIRSAPTGLLLSVQPVGQHWQPSTGITCTMAVLSQRATALISLARLGLAPADAGAMPVGAAVEAWTAGTGSGLSSTCLG